jgi:membrane protein YqaA with SNARE-associated domain
VVALLFLYAFLSNVALSVVPHEPVVAWYGARLGVWHTALVATAGTLAASWVDHRVFSRRVAALWAAARRRGGGAGIARLQAAFARAPFAVIAASGITPLPFWPFKAVAFGARYPLGAYLAAVAAGRLPRYLLLAWLGHALALPAWPLATAFLLLLLISLRGITWRPQRDT